MSSLVKLFTRRSRKRKAARRADWLACEFYAQKLSFEVMSLKFGAMLKLLSRDDLVVRSELDVFECVVAWCKHDIVRRKDDLATLLTRVRLTLLSKEQLEETTSDWLVGKNKIAGEMIKDAMHRIKTHPQRPRIIKT